MQQFLKLGLASLFVFASTILMAEPVPAWVRIRMHKELIDFPAIQGTEIKQVGENVWGFRGDHLKFNNKFLPHNNFITRKPNGRFDIISVLPFNEYLAGVVGSEMPISWPLEALKAQAVVARSYALAKIKERSSRTFHLESDQNDQVFLLSNSPKTRLAVADTDGVTLRKNNGNVLKAYYHADCGGETVKASDVWGPYEIDSGTALDPWCATKKSNQWNFEIPKGEFLQKLNLNGLEYQANNYTDKTQFLNLGGITFSVQKLRELFGFYKIRSSVDSIEVGHEKVKITGQGFGHGAGLCQWGTLAQVRMGKSYLQVLDHYYPKAKLVRDPWSSLTLAAAPQNSTN